MKRIKIIIIEDDADDYEYISSIVGNCEFSFEELWIKDGGEAIDFFNSFNTNKLQNDCVQLVFLDVNLPKASGFEVLKKIKSNQNCKDIFIAMLTGSKNPMDKAVAKKNGSNLYLEKPLGKQKIIEFEETIISKLNELAQVK